MPDTQEKIRILICDDEALIADDLQTRLKNLGYTICGQATSTEQALELVEQHQPDLVIMDIALPGDMDGINATEVIKDKWGIPVIFLTDDVDTDRLEQAELTYPFGYLLKPVQNRDLKKTIKMALYAAKVDAEKRCFEEAQRETEEIFKSFSENSLAGHYLIQDGLFKYVNPKFAEIFGYTVEECLGDMSFERLIHSEDIPTVKEQVDRRIKGQAKTVHYYFTGLKKNGDTVEVEIYGASMHYKGKPAAIGTILDITDRKLAEEALRESEKRYRTVLEIAMDGFCVINQTGRIIEVNESYCRMTGYSEQELLFMNVMELDTNETSEGFDRHLQKIIKEGKDRFETVHRRKDGSLFNVEISVQYNSENDGFFSTFLRDITDRMLAEEALRESENRYRSMIEFSPLGIGNVNMEGVVVNANPALASMLGYEAEELIGMNAGETLTHPDDLMRERKFLKPLLSGETSSYNLEKRFIHKNGEYYWYNTTVAKMLGPSGDKVLFGFIEDINTRKQLEQEREKLINDLQNALAEIKQLRGIFPICAHCKKIRDDKGYWQQVEKYIMDRTDARFSHGLCPDCLKELYPDISDKILKKLKIDE